jgi:hypothetical protein
MNPRLIITLRPALVSSSNGSNGRSDLVRTSSSLIRSFNRGPQDNDGRFAVDALDRWMDLNSADVDADPQPWLLALPLSARRAVCLSEERKAGPVVFGKRAVKKEEAEAALRKE